MPASVQVYLQIVISPTKIHYLTWTLKTYFNLGSLPLAIVLQNHKVHRSFPLRYKWKQLKELKIVLLGSLISLTSLISLD